VRILLATNYLPPYEGGIQFVVDHLARGYCATGHDVVMAGYDPARSKRGPVPYDVVSLPAWNPLEARSIPVPLYEPVTLWRTTRRLVRQVDAVHVHGLLYPNVLLTIWLAARVGRPVVLTEHVGLVSFGRPWLDRAQAGALRLAARTAGKRCRAVVVLNDRVRDELASALPVAVPLVRIDNGVDAEQFHPTSVGDRRNLREKWILRRPTALFVGRLSQKKGVSLVVEAARRTDRFDVIICGKDTEHLTDLPANVRVVGLVDQDQLAELYRAADLLLLPSEGEGFPLVIQEALASGLPVVVTDGTVAANDPGTGTIQFAERTPAGIVRAVHALLERDDLEKLGTLGREAAIEAFDWTSTAGRYLELFEDGR
jgi:D-inositol-3-phosphate glycosyltransferase